MMVKLPTFQQTPYSSYSCPMVLSLDDEVPMVKNTVSESKMNSEKHHQSFSQFSSSEHEQCIDFYLQGKSLREINDEQDDCDYQNAKLLLSGMMDMDIVPERVVDVCYQYLQSSPENAKNLNNNCNFDDEKTESSVHHDRASLLMLMSIDADAAAQAAVCAIEAGKVEVYQDEEEGEKADGKAEGEGEEDEDMEDDGMEDGEYTEHEFTETEIVDALSSTMSHRDLDLELNNLFEQHSLEIEECSTFRSAKSEQLCSFFSNQHPHPHSHPHPHPHPHHHSNSINGYMPNIGSLSVSVGACNASTNPTSPAANLHHHSPDSYMPAHPVHPVHSPGLVSPRCINTLCVKSTPTKPRLPDFNSMTIKSILDLRFDISVLLERGLLYRLMTDHFGSKYLQNIIKSSKEERTKHIISMMIHSLTKRHVDLCHLSEDIYGNYLIQLFFLCGTDDHHRILFDTFVYDSVLRLSRSKYGCRVVQKILSSVSNKEYLYKLVRSFEKQSSGKLRECLFCYNCNHVIQAILNLKLPLKLVQFVGDELQRDLVAYSDNVYSCRVVQVFLNAYGDKLDMEKLLEDNNHLHLCCLKYSNYVIQETIKKEKWYSNLASIHRFRNRLLKDAFSGKHIISLSNDKYGSNVMEKCIENASSKQLDMLVDKVISRRCFLLKQLITHRFGNYVPTTLLKNCNKKQKARLIRAVNQYIINVEDHQRYHYGHFKHSKALFKLLQEEQMQQQ